MATQNSINRATQDLTIDPGAAGDSWLQFSINGTGEFRIGVDDTDDSFRISQGNALGANDTFIMTDVGERTMPLQVAFAATWAVNGYELSTTGDGTVWQFGTRLTAAIFDQNGDYNTNGTFTAPVDGRYRLSTAYWMAEDSGGSAMTSTDCEISILTSNRTWTCYKMDPSAMTSAATTQIGMNMTVFVDMDASDTAVSRIMCNGAGAKVVDIYSHSVAPRTWFSGFLVC